MNRNRKKYKESPKTKESPPMFEDEETPTSESSGEVKTSVPQPPVTPEVKIITAHSTPIQNIIKSKSANSPEISYHESPIEPMTQNPPNEVGWDYQRPVVKDEQSNALDITKTPKRTALLNKKRSSNSPLLYKPLKKKLIQDEKHIHNSFLTDLQAIAISTKQSKELPTEELLSAESQLVVELDTQPSEDSDLKLQVTTNTDESPATSKIDNMKNNKYTAVLGDSVEDAVMIICSQDIEEKEKVTVEAAQTSHIKQSIKNEIPARQVLDVKTKFNIGTKDNDDSFEDLLAICSQKVEEKVLGIPSVLNNHKGIPVEVTFKFNSETSFKKPPQEDHKPIKSNEKAVNDDNKQSLSSRGDSNSLEIPDDSFDEIFGELDENFCKNENTKSVVGVNRSDRCTISLFPNNVPTVMKTDNSKTSNQVKKMVENNVPKNSYHCVDSKASNPTIQNKMVNTNANFGYLNKDYAQNQLGSAPQFSTSGEIRPSASRTFKAKSFSDSNFLEQSTFVNKYDQSETNLNSVRQSQKSINGSNPSIKSTESSRSDESVGWRRTNSSSAISTPAEIERKRQEALMRRQANINRKKLQNSTFNRHIQGPVQR